MIDLLVRNADWLITMDPERRMVRDGALAVDGGEIKAVGTTAGVEAAGYREAARTIDGRGRLITPGFVDNHQHLAPFFVRGLGDDVPLKVFLHDRCYPMEAGVTDEEAYLAAMCALLESVRHGTTTLCDPGSQNPENSARAVDEVGCRAVLSRSLTDLAGGRAMPGTFDSTTDDAIAPGWTSWSPMRGRPADGSGPGSRCAPSAWCRTACAGPSPSWPPSTAPASCRT